MFIEFIFIVSFEIYSIDAIVMFLQKEKRCHCIEYKNTSAELLTSTASNCFLDKMWSIQREQYDDLNFSTSFIHVKQALIISYRRSSIALYICLFFSTNFMETRCFWSYTDFSRISFSLKQNDEFWTFLESYFVYQNSNRLIASLSLH